MVFSSRVKIGILSHILPPSPSGQAIMLDRLLRGIPSDEYCLLSREDYSLIEYTDPALTKLPGKYHHLRSVVRLPELNRRFLSMPILVLNTVAGIIHRARQIEKILRSEGVRVLISCSGDLLDIPAGAMAANRAGVPFIPYIFDDYAYQWMGNRRTIAKIIEPYIMKRASAVVVANEFMCREYSDRYGVRTSIIHNPCSMPDLAKIDREPSVFANYEKVIVYTGAVYHAHYDAFRNLITAIALLGRPEIKFHIFTAQPAEELSANGIHGPAVVLHPHIPQEEVSKVQRCADILFLPLAFDSPIPEVIRTSAPGKMGEYLSVGRPILAHTPPNSFVGWYLNEHRCGKVADQDDPASLALIVSQLLADDNLREDLGERARARAEADFDVRNIQCQFYDLVQRITGGRS